jgi:hypothetical protein
MLACKINPHFHISVWIESIPLWTPEAIDSQAWCLQDIAFAPHALVYGSRMRASLCDRGVRTEQGDTSLVPSALMKPQYGPRLSQAHWSWGALVLNYTRRYLSDERDKLSAISGLACHFHLTLGGCYFAGLWKYNLITYLR